MSIWKDYGNTFAINFYQFTLNVFILQRWKILLDWQLRSMDEELGLAVLVLYIFV